MGACLSGVLNCQNLWVSVQDVTRARGSAAVIGRYHVDRPLSSELRVEARELGSGQSGVVRLATDKEGRKFALKSIDKTKACGDQVEFLQREVNIHLSMDHPHIAKLEHVFESTETLQLVTEHMPGGDLYDRLSQRGRYSEREAAACAAQLLQAVSYLHSNHVVHRDLKLENILCANEAGTYLKIIDFGLAAHWDGSTPLSQICGTTACIAPEVFKGAYTDKADIWSLGLIVYELLTKHSAFLGNGQRMKEQVKAGRVCYGSRFAKLSGGAREFVQHLLTVDPEKRPTASEALRHPWLQSHCPTSASPDANIMQGFVDMAHQSHCKRLCFEMIASELPLEEQVEFEKQFNAIDADKNGSITVGEFCDAMKSSLGMETSSAEELFYQLTSCHEGMTYSEFVAAALQRHAREHGDACWAAFRRFSSCQERHRRMSSLSTALPLGRRSSRSTALSLELEEMVGLTREANTNSDGVVSYADFLTFVDAPGC